jgi:hypothetical protein
MGIRKSIVRIALKILLWKWRSREIEPDFSVPWIAAEDCQRGDIVYADLAEDRLTRRPGRNRLALYRARRDITAGELVYDDLMAPGRSDLEFFRRRDK